MDIICLASSSQANAYIIRNEVDTLLVECGLDFKTLKTRMLKERIVLSRLSAVAVTHHHGDHSRSSDKVSLFAPLIASKETLANIKVARGAEFPATEWQPITLPTFTIIPFAVDHDCEGAFGFIINDTLNKDSLLFINDTKFVKYDFSNHQFDHIMIECNHNDEILDRADVRTQRTAKAHMSLETVKLTLSKMNLSKTKAIYLMHLSDSNSDQERMIKEVQELTGKPTYVCLKDGGVASGAIY
jgi:ribonuclease BN (tRNA processing enzyme)